MHIDDILAATRNHESIQIPANWGQGRTLFGGVTGAILCQACAEGIEPARLLKSFEVGFVRPFEAHKPYEISIEVLAEGRTVIIKEARITQAGKLRATGRANFVRPLESEVVIEPFVVPDIKPLADSVAMNSLPLPDFIHHFDNYCGTEGLPFSATNTDQLGGWMRYKEAPKTMSDAHLVGLIDAWPPTASPRYTEFKPLSTLTWTIHFAHPARLLQSDQHLGYLAKVNYGENGLSSSTTQVWDQQGNLVANSFQTNIIYG